MTAQPIPTEWEGDQEIERTARTFLNWSAAVPVGSVTISVHNRAITLTGIVMWAFQRDAAIEAVREIQGVRAIRDEIAVIRMV
jgi:osmotically-inducible protein OsmY